MISLLEASLLSFIDQIPLTFFVFIASFIEEVFAPIPSASVLLVTGAAASIQGKSVSMLVPLIILAAIGKTLGAICVYYLSSFFGEILVSRFGRWFGITEKNLLQFEGKLTKTKKTFLVLVLFRTLPIVPSTIISIGGGILKLPISLFILSTVIGTAIRDAIFIYIGFSGTDLWKGWLSHTTTIESYVQILIVLSLLLLGLKFYLKVKKSRN